MAKRGRKKQLIEVQGFKIGAIVVIGAKNTFHGQKLAVVTDQCKWDDEGIVCTLFDTDFPFRNVVIFPNRGDTIKVATK